MPEKVREPYGITLATGAARSITEHHASRLTEADVTPDARRAPEQLTLIAESDGSMIPVVQTGTPDGEVGEADRRKTRQVFWKEAKLSMIRQADEGTPVFAVTLGDAAAAGADRMRLAVATGYHPHSRVHGLGDGATWIADQMERPFGAQGAYHVDFYPVCADLAAAQVCAANDPGWMSARRIV